MSKLSTTRFPQPQPARASWMDEVETVPFTDDFLDALAESQRAPSSAPPSSGIRAKGSDDSRPPDSGLGSLRPYVGHSPKIRPVTSTAALARATPSASIPLGGAAPFREAAPLEDTARLRWVKGFAWGAALTSLVFGAAAYHLRAELPAKVQTATPPVELDGDRILPPAPEDLASRARNGERAALQALEEQESKGLSAREALALVEGEEAKQRLGAEEFVKKLSLGPKEEVSAEKLFELFALVNDPNTFRATALALAEAETQLGADLLYEVMRHVRLDPDKSALVLQLLLSSGVRKSASPALAVILEAESVRECEEVRSLLERTLLVGDSRAIRHMAKFAERTGCGELARKDCYPCLRQDRQLVDALRAAQERRAPF